MIQALRALAATLVLCWHVFQWPDWGSAGVDIFFPISGFVMVLTTYRLPKGEAPEFFARRLIRIAPMYWCATIILFFLRKDQHSSFMTLAKSLLFLPTDAHPWLSDGGYYPVLIVGWTLNIEMLFYFILAAALLLPRAWTYLGLTVAIVLLVAIGAAYDTTFPIETFYLTNPLMIEFLFGVAIGLLYLSGVRLHSLWCLVAAAAVLCVVAWFPVGSGFIRVLEWGIPSAIIVALVTMGPQPKTGSLVAGGLIVAGDISYALYVTHIVTLIAMRHFGFPSWSIFTASIIAAASTYLWFERPVTGWLQYSLKRHQQRRLAQT